MGQVANKDSQTPTRASSGLAPETELVVLARALHRLGCQDYDLGGHVSYLLPDETILITPQDRSWHELLPDELVRLNLDGTMIGDGHWFPNGKELHFAAHRRMPNAVLSVHHHGRWSTVWASAERIPPVYNVNSLLTGNIGLFREFDAGNRSDVGDRFIDTMEEKEIVLLSHHGAFLTGSDPAQIYHRCVALEWRCKMSWHVEAMAGARPPAPMPVPHYPHYMTRESGDAGVAPALWDSIVSRELAADPSLRTA